MRLIVVGLAFIVSSYLLRFSFGGRPFLLIFLLGSACGVFSIVITRNRRLRRLALVATGTVFSFFLVEACFCVMAHERVVGDYVSFDYFDQDTDLGYQAVPNARVTARKSIDNDLLYSVDYTIDEQGQRRTPGDPSSDTIVFFGGSYTFGEGVPDQETLPAVVSRSLDFKYNVVNFGFHGWGHTKCCVSWRQRENVRA